MIIVRDTPAASGDTSEINPASSMNMPPHFAAFASFFIVSISVIAVSFLWLLLSLDDEHLHQLNWYLAIHWMRVASPFAPSKFSRSPHMISIPVETSLYGYQTRLA